MVVSDGMARVMPLFCDRRRAQRPRGGDAVLPNRRSYSFYGTTTSKPSSQVFGGRFCGANKASVVSDTLGRLTRAPYPFWAANSAHVVVVFESSSQMAWEAPC